MRGQDYVLDQTHIAILNGSNATRFSVTPINDSLYEGGLETVQLRLQSITPVIDSTRLIATGYIEDDEVLIVTFSAEQEGGERNILTETAQPLQILARADLINHSASALVFDYVVSGKAQAAVDYTTVTIGIPVGERVGLASFTVRDDGLFEDHESVIVNISTVTQVAVPESVIVNDPRVESLIRDNDIPSTLHTRLVGEPTEGDELVIEFSLDRPNTTGQPIDIGYTLSGDISNEDFYFVEQDILQTDIAEHSTHAIVRLRTVTDLLFESTETIIVEPVSISVDGIDQLRIATGTLTDSDDAILSQRVIRNGREGTDNQEVVIELYLNKINHSPRPIDVRLSLYDEFTRLSAVSTDARAIVVEVSTADYIISQANTVYSIVPGSSDGVLETRIQINPGRHQPDPPVNRGGRPSVGIG